jgi:hypothetical protein
MYRPARSAAGKAATTTSGSSGLDNEVKAAVPDPEAHPAARTVIAATISGAAYQFQVLVRPPAL